jgi:hypothetical protein
MFCWENMCQEKEKEQIINYRFWEVSRASNDFVLQFFHHIGVQCYRFAVLLSYGTRILASFPV